MLGWTTQICLAEMKLVPFIARTAQMRHRSTICGPIVGDVNKKSRAYFWQSSNFTAKSSNFSCKHYSHASLYQKGQSKYQHQTSVNKIQEESLVQLKEKNNNKLHSEIIHNTLLILSS